MAKIKIIKTPAGQAPDWVRDAWVGLEMPIREDGQVVMGRLRGVLGGPPDKENVGGFHVDTGMAVKILEEKNPKAADWWRKNLSPFSISLVFGKRYCVLLK